MVGSLLMGSPTPFVEPEGEREVGYNTQVDNSVNTGNTGVNSAPIITADYPPMNLGESFRPTIDQEEMLRREEAKRKLQALFGGKL